MNSETLAIDCLRSAVIDLEGVAPTKVGSTHDAQNAAAWLDETRRIEADAEDLLGPEIKAAFDKHRSLTGARKKLFEKLDGLKNSLRGSLAHWISRGNPVEGYRVQTKWAIVGFNLADVPEEYKITTVDEKKVLDWVKQTEGKVIIPGVEVKSVPVLYARGEK